MSKLVFEQNFSSLNQEQLKRNLKILSIDVLKLITKFGHFISYENISISFILGNFFFILRMIGEWTIFCNESCLGIILQNFHIEKVEVHK